MSKSKEDILFEIALKKEKHDDDWVTDDLIYAMEEWAKQQVIAYETWLDAELNNDASFNYGKTPEELYNLFLESQTSNQ